ncbi:Uncharacterised protein [Vibrio cholerae]|nr:Uncharacterised protein [Vibrio cholerae]
MNRRIRHFTHVMRWNVGGHTYRDAGDTIEQNVRQTRWQHFRLLHGAVKVWLPIYGALA